MYDRTELKILEQVYLKPGIHKRELSKQLNIGMPSIDYALKKIERLLKKQKSGNQIKYFLDYSKGTLTPMMYVVEYSRLGNLPAKIKLSINDFLKELKEKPVIVAIFGSHAKGNYTKDSDIDILLVFQKIEDEKQIENTAKKISMRTNTVISPVYLDYGAFRDSFHNLTKEFFKNLKKDKIIIAGIEWWRQLESEEA
ncbi:MAG: nucleotidyltransferase domain-containing protein [Nanoarchaeota archaeon]|nr:nucleotidyltransferase domain-containing protein [Nanoarchaeota archaeon]